MAAILRRELFSYFNTAIGYVVLTVFYFFGGMFFADSISYYQVNSLEPVFSPMFLIILFLIPILTMKSFSEERRQKTDQALLTAPVDLWKIVMGKFMGALILFVVCLSCFLVYSVVLSFFATPQWSQIFCTLFGLLLYGAALIAIDVFISALTESQVVAAVAGMGAGLFIYMFNQLAESVSIDWIKNVINGVSFQTRYNTFTTGILNVSDAVFFVSVVAVFLFLTIRVFDKKRWA